MGSLGSCLVRWSVVVGGALYRKVGERAIDVPTHSVLFEQSSKTVVRRSKIK